MAGTYSPSAPTDVDFTVRKATPPAPTDTDFVVNGDERIARYTPPLNDSVNMTLQEDTTATNDDTDLVFPASDTELYNSPGQNDVNYTITSYTATEQNDTDYVLGEPRDTTYQPPVYSPAQPDQLEFNLRGYAEDQPDDLTFRISEYPDSVGAEYPVDNLSTKDEDLLAEESSNTVNEIGSAIASLDAGEGSHTQQPISASFESLTAGQSDYLEADIGNTAEAIRYVAVLFAGFANVDVENNSTESDSQEQAVVPNGLEVLDPLQSDYAIANTDVTVLEFEGQQTSYTFTQNDVLVEDLVREPGDQVMAEIRTSGLLENLSASNTPTQYESAPGTFSISDLSNPPDELPIGEVVSTVTSLVAQQDTITQSVVNINAESRIAEVSTSLITPVANVVNTLKEQQSEMSITVIPNTVQLSTESQDPKRIPQSIAQISVNLLNPNRESLRRGTSEVSNTILQLGYERPTAPISQVRAEATQVTTVSNGEYEHFEVSSFTDARNDIISQHVGSPVNNTADDPDYVFPEYPVMPGLFTTLDGDAVESDHEQGYAQFSSASYPIENDSYVEGAAVASQEDVDRQKPKYDVGETSSVVVSFSLPNGTQFVAGELAADTFVVSGTTNGEHEILFIEMPIEKGLEYFEREDIGPGGGAVTSGGKGLSFSSDFGLIKSGSKTIVLF